MKILTRQFRQLVKVTRLAFIKHISRLVNYSNIHTYIYMFLLDIVYYCGIVLEAFGKRGISVK